MTERELLEENNNMLKYIVNFINEFKNNKTSNDMNDFIMNVIANQFNLQKLQSKGLDLF